MGRQLQLLFFLGTFVLFAAKSLCQEQSCYYPDGSIASDDYRCDSGSGVSVCCGEKSWCLYNGLCYDTVTGAFARGSCTDSSWSSSSCPYFCTSSSEKLDGGQLMSQCDNRDWCCGLGECCSKSEEDERRYTISTGFNIQFRSWEKKSTSSTIYTTKTETVEYAVTNEVYVTRAVGNTDIDTITETETTTVSDTITETETVGGAGAVSITRVSTVYLPTGGTEVGASGIVCRPTGAGADADISFQTSADGGKKTAMIVGVVLGVALLIALILLGGAIVKIVSLNHKLDNMRGGMGPIQPTQATSTQVPYNQTPYNPASYNQASYNQTQ